MAIGYVSIQAAQRPAAIGTHTGLQMVLGVIAQFTMYWMLQLNTLEKLQLVLEPWEPSGK